jgi:hypothetical protein
VRNAYGIWSEGLKERYHLEDLDVDGDNIKMDLKSNVACIHLAQDRSQWLL